MRNNILKGIKRLTIATLTVCGVGLFLFGSEVKADDFTGGSFSYDSTSHNYGFVLTPDSSLVSDVNIMEIDYVVVGQNGASNYSYSIQKKSDETTPTTPIDSFVYDGSSSKFIPTFSESKFEENVYKTLNDASLDLKNYIDSTGVIRLASVTVHYTLGSSTYNKSSSPYVTLTPTSTDFDLAKLYSIKAVPSPTALPGNSSSDTYYIPQVNGSNIGSDIYDITVTSGGNTKTYSGIGYGYENDTYTISKKSESAFVSTNYYMNLTSGSTASANTSWVMGADSIVSTATAVATANVEQPVYYAPIIGGYKITNRKTGDVISLGKSGTSLLIEAELIPASNSDFDRSAISKYPATFTVKSFQGLATQLWNPTSTTSTTCTVSLPAIANIDEQGYIISASTNVGVLASGQLSGLTTNGYETPIKPIVKFAYVQVDADKTKAEFAKGYNYITAGYTLDLNNAFKLYDKDGNVVSGKTIKWNKTSDSNSGAELSSSDYKLKGTKYTEVKLTANIYANASDATAEMSITDIPVTVYPMPEVKYTSGKGSNRKLEITVPAKTSTGYDAKDKNLDEVRGFKLELCDSNGNTLYAYDDGKFADVVKSASVSNGVKTYSVSYTDVEAMVTYAANNGKFSADSTPVYFKVTPMGYRNGSSSNIIADSKIFAKSDNTNVYKVTATGENITPASAYGLEGQEIKLTATPVAGYTFSKWSDGNTSPTKTVTVSASTGSNVYRASAVLGSRQDGTNADGTSAGGYDDVPKTAESNAPIWIILIMVFAFIGGGYALFLQIRPQEENR